MEDNLLYQNIDTQTNNPLSPSPDTTSQIPENKENKTPSKKFTLPKDPKILLLFGLLAILAFLSVLSIIVVAFRNSKPATTKNFPIPTPKTTNSPSPINTQIPPEFQSQFEEIDREIKQDEEFLPPDINVEIGR